jgi:hypothetical protein
VSTNPELSPSAPAPARACDVRRRRRTRLLFHLAGIACLAAGVSLALAHTHSASGPDPSYTGAPALGAKPAENKCVLCHSNFEWNNLDTPGGSIELMGVPETYDLGATYPLTIKLNSDSTAAAAFRKWGFQITAVRASDGEGVGTFVLPDPDTLKIVSGSGTLASRQYLEHAPPGTRTGLAGPVTWSFSWQAPATAQGRVYFFFAGNAADGTGDPGNDFIFTGSATVRDATVPVRPTTWAAIKNRYR